jgi:molybdate transport system substrate-binding protein
MKAKITGISSMATSQLLADLIPQFEERSGRTVAIESVGGVEAAKRVQAGEPFDVVVLGSNAIDQLIAAGRIIGGSKVDLARSGVAIAVRSGAVRPEIDTEEAVKRAVQAARSIGYSTGPSGTHLTKVFESWGIVEEIRDRLVQAPPGVPVGRLIAEGKVELGFQQLSELMHVSGVDVIGVLPPAIQIITTFSAGICTSSTQVEGAREMLAFMTSPMTAEVKRRNGMEPA